MSKRAADTSGAVPDRLDAKQHTIQRASATTNSSPPDSNQDVLLQTFGDSFSHSYLTKLIQYHAVYQDRLNGLAPCPAPAAAPTTSTTTVSSLEAELLALCQNLLTRISASDPAPASAPAHSDTSNNTSSSQRAAGQDDMPLDPAQLAKWRQWIVATVQKYFDTVKMLQALRIAISSDAANANGVLSMDQIAQKTIERSEAEFLTDVSRDMQSDIKMIMQEMTRDLTRKAQPDQAATTAEQEEEKAIRFVEQQKHSSQVLKLKLQGLERLVEHEKASSDARCVIACLEDEKSALTAQVRRLEDELKASREKIVTWSECPICLVEFSSDDAALAPRVIPCGHTVCENCVTQLREGTRNLLKCPKCQQEYIKWSEFPKNYHVISNL